MSIGRTNPPRPLGAATATAELDATMPRTPRKAAGDALPPVGMSGPAGARRRFLREYEAFHADLRERDPSAWAELEAERRAWDATLLDGLEDE